MRPVIAYLLVLPLVQFCLVGGIALVGFPLALLLAWTPISLRTRVAGVVGGIAGVALAVAFGFGVFRFVVGPDSYSIGAFLASTVPLLLPIRTDFLRWRKVDAARQELLQTFRESRGEEVEQKLVAETETAQGSGLIGYMLGLVLVTMWFFTR